MNKKTWTALAVSILLFAGGLFVTLQTRADAIVKGAAASATVPFALGLILTLLGLLGAMVSLLPEQKNTDVRTLTLAAIFAALCYVGFTYLRIDIPVGTEKTAFHLGNVFCVLAALFVGGFWGGMAGAIGMTLADLTTAYVTSAPKTFLLKLGIGLITGLLAHKVFHISREKARQKLPLPAAVVLSSAGGMAFNIVADPLVGYFYKMYVLGVPQEVATIWAKMGAVTTAINALVAVVVASVLYLALQPALKRSRLLREI